MGTGKGNEKQDSETIVVQSEGNRVEKHSSKGKSTTFLLFPLSGPQGNKLAKARKKRKLPGTLGLKKFWPGKLRVTKVWFQHIYINFLTKLDNFKKINFRFFFFNFLYYCNLSGRPFPPYPDYVIYE